MNDCGQPNVLQIRSHVSKFGERAPDSSSRYSRTLSGTGAMSPASSGVAVFVADNMMRHFSTGTAHRHWSELERRGHFPAT